MRDGERDDGDDDLTDEAERDIDRGLDVTTYAVRRSLKTPRDLENELPTHQPSNEIPISRLTPLAQLRVGADCNVW